jgi:hypothetical protein
MNSGTERTSEPVPSCRKRRSPTNQAETQKVSKIEKTPAVSIKRDGVLRTIQRLLK